MTYFYFLIHHSNPLDSPVNNGVNPFGDGDDDVEPDPEEPPSEGWTVRALYDYVKAEDDELEFKSGEWMESIFFLEIEMTQIVKKFSFHDPDSFLLIQSSDRCHLVAQAFACRLSV